MHFSTFLLKTWNFLLNDGAIFEHLNHVHVCQVASIVSNSVRPYGLWPTRLLCPWNSPGKNTGVGCHALLQRIFPTQGSNPKSLMSPALLAGSLPLPLGNPRVFTASQIFILYLSVYIAMLQIVIKVSDLVPETE